MKCLVWFLVWCHLLSASHASRVPCTSDEECSNILKEGSTCRERFCTNPFYHGGCLKNRMPAGNSQKVRMCNSDDPPEALAQGDCRQSPLDYMEVRVLSQNWESTILLTWVYQILLSELLEVPVSIEAGPGFSNDFYSRESALDYGTWDGNYAEVSTASRTGDCRTIKTDNPDERQGCAHVILESWRWGSVSAEIEHPRALGVLGIAHWYVPKFTIQREPSLVYYLGMGGEHNRRKLAEFFKSPTTWKQYCDEVSTNHCVTEDGTAKRAPIDESEEESMFVEGLYTGHFRYKEENDCDRYPTNCTGHFAAYPCSWLSYTWPWLYHHKISLKPGGPAAYGGYKSSQLQQMWRAANATKENLITEWYAPHGQVSQFSGTDAEYTPIVLPPPTQECEDSRIDVRELCGDDHQAKVGEPEGACDKPDKVLKKVVAAKFYDTIYDTETPQPLWSPAYEVTSNFKFTALNLEDIFKKWYEVGIDPKYDPREATCQWVIENLDLLDSFIPDSYPRVVQEEDGTGNALFIGATVMAVFALLLVLSSALITYWKRNSKTMYYAQVPYLVLVLSGLFLVGLGGLVTPLPPRDSSCVLAIWLTDLGFVLQLVPLVVRIHLINTLTGAGKQMHRVQMRIDLLVKLVAVVVFIVGAFLVAWTIVDAPHYDIQYDLTGRTTPDGENVVTGAEFCGTDSDFWPLFSFLWQGVILLPGGILAFIASRVLEDLNDTRPLGMTIGSHLFFLVLRACVYAFGENEADVMRYESILLSGDTIICTAIYFFPKFINSGEAVQSEILPDLFLNTTIVVVTIEGFTAWSSVREPVQVFKYLESVFEQMDVIAERYKVYKVETSGACYVAAAGIPEARADHAVVMARYASDCMEKMDGLSRKLEVQYGTGTCDLNLRMGMHSGPVTGGFMKGKHSRFQLFGDTMTTASLIHETGETQYIHMSQHTANLLAQAGRTRWTKKRDVPIQTFEKGKIQTFWLTRCRHGPEPEGTNNSSRQGVYQSPYSSEAIDDELKGLDSEARWIEWNVEVLRGLLVNIVARRPKGHAMPRDEIDPHVLGEDSAMPLDEVQEIIELPSFDCEATKRQRQNVGQVQLPNVVLEQLREQVTQIASMYEPNPFHNFARASYVVMAVTKYLHRITAASEIEVENGDDQNKKRVQAAIHDHTYGITSDPLTQFACAYSALIHDLDHPGVPNQQLITEGARVASVYKNRSIAEQKSFDISWDLFIDPAYKELRMTICSSEAELRRFRLLIINSVMATDLADNDLKRLRNDRWAKAFDETRTQEVMSSQDINRKATIVIEHLIQAADVAHTCQHWNMYRKWNLRFFEECYKAYQEGRAEKNPAEYWYQVEIGFFDLYVIPLSKKLRDCRVFGPTSDENLGYAESNRSMWVNEGETIVEEMMRRMQDNPEP